MERHEPLNPGEKDYLIRRKQAGTSYTDIAHELKCSRETVRKWWRAQRRGTVPRKRGRPATGILSTFSEEIGQIALTLKQAHPHWGPVNVLVELRKTLASPARALPSPSRLSAWFKARCPQALQRRSPPTLPAVPPEGAAQVHQCWQIDAKEAIRLRDGSLASYLDIRDPVSAVMIAAQAFVTTLPPASHRKITLREIQAVLRQAFTVWGKPAEIQTDHEDVYAGAHQSDFPAPFTLWLVGLGIRHSFSRERHPTDQPQIERNHRTLGDLGWKDQPPHDLEDFQQQLDRGRQRYNWEFPAHAADCQGQPPLLRHPQALFSGRRYQADWEWDLWDLSLVDAYLAQRGWVRKVDSQGIVFVGNHPYGLGKKYKQQRVIVHFRPEDRVFSFETEAGEAIKTLPAIGLEKADLTGLIPTSIPTGISVQLPLPWVGV